ncbi:uncharacterized protein SAPINGB_P001627 [Magnusiomyces paraingens]|uniref:Uncharacterized protein n=1 Tax=Magnusiomyces paraingens TaxID=2606893 RepID=A0A5E8B6P5_9ASCO|nr:uncharacterized protein SAPINGB_P001627 [Saprochaete ingens]VVT47269.1 unnamed protein product [Saprochaete ingens]
MSDPKSAVDSEEYHIERHPNHDFMTTTHGIARVLTSDTHVQMGDLTFHKDDFMRAFEGYLNPGLSERPSRAFANPVPLGVASFALSLFVVSLTNIHARGVSNGAGAAGLCLFYAGFIELCAGMWCIVLENAWAATLISSFAGFWMSYGLFLIDGFGIVSSYTNTDDLHNMLGFYLLGWTIFATIMWSMTFRSTWVFFFMMLFVVLTLVILCGANFTMPGNPTRGVNLTKAGGYFGIITSLIGWYVVYEALATKENSLLVPPVLLMPTAVLGRERKNDEKV